MEANSAGGSQAASRGDGAVDRSGFPHSKKPRALLSLSARITRRDLMAIGVGAALAALAKGESVTMPESAKFDQRVSVLTLGVRDLAASRKFYVQGLGWKPAFENNDIIFFQAGGMVFALFAHEQLA